MAFPISNRKACKYSLSSSTKEESGAVACRPNTLSNTYIGIFFLFVLRYFQTHEAKIWHYSFILLWQILFNYAPAIFILWRYRFEHRKSISFKFVLQVITDAKYRVCKKNNLSRALGKQSTDCLTMLIITFFFSFFFPLKRQLQWLRRVLRRACSPKTKESVDKEMRASEINHFMC